MPFGSAHHCPSPCMLSCPWQVIIRLSTLIESSLIGATSVRRRDMSTKVIGPSLESEAPRNVCAYHKTNPRHTTRELLKYCRASRSSFEDTLPRFSSLALTTDAHVLFGFSCSLWLRANLQVETLFPYMFLSSAVSASTCICPPPCADPLGLYEQWGQSLAGMLACMTKFGQLGSQFVARVRPLSRPHWCPACIDIAPGVGACFLCW